MDPDRAGQFLNAEMGYELDVWSVDHLEADALGQVGVVFMEAFGLRQPLLVGEPVERHQVKAAPCQPLLTVPVILGGRVHRVQEERRRLVG